jgi:hypothetical protein
MKEMMLGGQSLLIGRGSLDGLKNIAARRAFIVTGGSSMFKCGVIARIEALLQGVGCETQVYSGIAPNPDTGAVLDGVAAMRRFGPDVLVAVGGGSPIDAAKVMGLFYEYPELDFETVLNTPLPERRKELRLVAIPSTSGTAAEVTKAAVITFPDQNLKIGLKTAAFVPDIAILDAELTMSMPPNIVAETGMDAMTHAVECFINRSLDDFTEALAKGAVAGLFEQLPVSYRDKTIESREKVHHYQCMAGLAFSNVGLGLAHGIAHAVGGMFGLGHGLINAVVLPYVLEYNAQDGWVQSQLAKLARCIEREDFIEAIWNLNRQLDIPISLAEAGLEQQEFAEAIPRLVDNCLKGSTRVNPVKIEAQQMTELLKLLYEGRSSR